MAALASGMDAARRRISSARGARNPSAAQTPIAPHLSYRKALYHFPDLGPSGGEAAEFVILDRVLIWGLFTRDPFRNAFPGLVAALAPKGYEKVLDEDGILIFRRATSLSPRESREESIERR